MEQREFSPGSLVTARGREWVVLPNPNGGADSDLLLVRPIDGSESETTGILRSLERVEPATFSAPSIEDIGDHRSCRLLRDAVRLGVRNAAGPFASFGRIAVEPRAYQFAPLILALRQDPVRLLIADDVGIGKTVEAGLIVRELIDRGEIRRFCVVCPPYLVDQWKRELDEKFHLDATTVTSTTIKALERQRAPGESVFEVFPHTVVSLDFIKSEKRRSEFLRTAPELLVFDEAHALATNDPGARHLRHDMAQGLCSDPNRGVLLLTATPHSGKENAFRSLLGLLNPEFLDETKFPTDLSGDENRERRQELSRWFVQRRRGDVRAFLDEKTTFPEVLESEIAWEFSPEYREVFASGRKLIEEILSQETDSRLKKLGAWWRALSLLRSLASSPAAAAATLRNRSRLIDESDLAEGNEDDEARVNALNELGERLVFDGDANDDASVSDAPLGANPDESEEKSDPLARKMAALAKRAEGVKGPKTDWKLKRLIEEIKRLTKSGYHPIVFCRFLPTVDYLREELQSALGSSATVVGVTGELAPEERERRIAALEDEPKRVLVCTDCLSEGINLQNLFDATIHYDLSWNPTRAEQREGRVDRFGQTRETVRTTTFYGKETIVDGIVLNVLMRKHRAIKKSLGVSVPVPCDANKLLETLMKSIAAQGELVGSKSRREPRSYLPGFEDYLTEIMDEAALNEAKRVQEEWDAAAKKVERQSQTYFAHRALAKGFEEVKRELDATRESIGSSTDVRSFALEVLRRTGATATEDEKSGTVRIDLSEADPEVRAFLPEDYVEWRVGFDLPVPGDAEFVGRTHPLVAGLSEFVFTSALDSEAVRPLARRLGVSRTDAVSVATTLFLVRRRFHVVSKRPGGETHRSLAEEVGIVGFEGSLSSPRRLSEEELDRALSAAPKGNVPAELARSRAEGVLAALPGLRSEFDAIARERAEALREARERVRRVAKLGSQTEVSPELPGDLLGIYVLLPSPKL